MKMQIGSTSIADLKGVSLNIALKGKKQVEQTAIQHRVMNERAKQSENRGPAFKNTIWEKRLIGRAS